MALDEGYIKFNLHWQQDAPLSKDDLREIMYCRDLCFQKRYIGIADGVGYGNISTRKGGEVIISGTQTGGIAQLSAEHFTLITVVNFEKNTVFCRGPVKASAESLTHAMMYQLDENIRGVIHIHHRKMWEQLQNKVPTTGASVPYGTIAMCHEVERLYKESDLKEKKIIVMAGHQDGIISFGNDLKEALHLLEQHELSL